MGRLRLTSSAQAGEDEPRGAGLTGFFDDEEIA